jgi:periplasmic protein TonB
MSKLSVFEDSWVNTVFEGRNQSYGAYDLRKKNPRTTMIALIIGAVLFVTAIVFAFFTADRTPEKDEVVREVKLKKVPKKKKKEEPKKVFEEKKKPEPVKKAQTATDIKKFVPPVVVPERKVEEEIKSTDELKDVKTGSNDVKSNESGGLPTQNDAANENEEGKVLDLNRTFGEGEVDIAAEFPGGINKFRERLQRDFSLPQLDEPTTGTVKVRFQVAKDGKVSNVEVVSEKPPGKGFGAEAKRVVAKSPRWLPGKKGGRDVDSWHSVTFSITAGGEDE